VITPAPHIMIVEARYYDDIQDSLLAGATQVLDAAGASHETFSVPGAFEIPSAVAYAARSLGHNESGRRFDGFIALGCVIRGETTHYDHICAEVSRGLMDLGTRYGLAIGFGVLTVENRDQAMVRAEPGGKRDTGGHAARTCLRMVELKQHFHLYPR
jgi:6,7-dimethyl-8-ribityllumazine synthase